MDEPRAVHGWTRAGYYRIVVGFELERDASASNRVRELVDRERELAVMQAGS